MKIKQTRWLFALFTFLTGTPPVPVPSTLAQAGDPLVMVVNKSNPVETINKGEARRLVLGQTSAWSDGKKVVVVLPQPASPDRAAVLETICGMSEAEYRRFQMQVAFTGREGTKMQEEPSSVAVKAFVKANPGAVAFLRQAAVDKELKAVLTL
jgi:ABC-type phosphate transport system substrate-binding protein